MTRLAMIVALATVACSKGAATGNIDAPPADSNVDAPDADTTYHHTITIDGVDDFLSPEQFATTSAGYDARITWDAQNLYVGYSGTDLDPAAADTATKWLFVYLDVDPGMPNGSLVDESYNTQGGTFPTGFRADYYMRWKCDASLLSLKKYNGAAWADDATVPNAGHGGSFVELALPRAVLGTSSKISVVTFMINEKQNAEGTYAGLYAGNFTDGYHPSLLITKFLKIDFASMRDPNSPMNQGP